MMNFDDRGGKKNYNPKALCSGDNQSGFNKTPITSSERDVSKQTPESKAKSFKTLSK